MTVTNVTSSYNISMALKELGYRCTAIVSANTWAQWNILEALARNLSTFCITCFLAYWAMGEVSVLFPKDNTIINTAVVLSNRYKL